MLEIVPSDKVVTNLQKSDAVSEIVVKDTKLTSPTSASVTLVNSDDDQKSTDVKDDETLAQENLKEREDIKSLNGEPMRSNLAWRNPVSMQKGSLRCT